MQQLIQIMDSKIIFIYLTKFQWKNYRKTYLGWFGLAIEFAIIIQVQNTSFIKSNNCIIWSLEKL